MSDYRDPACPSCGKKYADHDGLIKVCARVEQVKMILDKLKRVKLSPREALKSIEELCK